MKLITTKVHGVLDYLMGVLLIASPWIFGFAGDGAETWVPVILGASTIVYSLLTDYELGVYRTMSMRSHLTLDFISGAFLAISPWVFGFKEYVFLPHLVLGLLEIGAVMLTELTPRSATHRTSMHRHAH